jgi:hypothetical protein
MSAEIATLSEPADAPAWDAAGDGCAAPSAERRLRMLDRLAEAGLEIALAIERRVKDAPPEQPLAELNAAAMAYARAARAVRLAVLLQEQLTVGGVDPVEAARQAEAERKKAHIARAVRVVERVAMRCQIKPSRVGDYVYTARERLDDDDIYGLVTSRPVGELVALICRDLGLQPDWDALAEEAWAQAEIASGAEGSPFLEDWDEEDAELDEAPLPHAGEVAQGAGEGVVGPAWRPPTFEDRLLRVASDPAIIAAARRESG